MNRWLGAAVQTVLLALWLWVVGRLLIPLALGAVFALILAPIERRLRAGLGRFGRIAPMLLTLIAMVLVVLPLGVIAARVAIAAASFFSGEAHALVDNLQRFGASYLAWFASTVGVPQATIRARLVELVQRAAMSLASSAASLAQALPQQVVGIFVFAVALFFFLRDGGRFTHFLLSISPFRGRATDALASSLQSAVRGLIVGQLATSSVQGGLTLGALLLFGVPGAPMLAVVATVLTVFPLVGTVPVTVGAVLYLLTVGRYPAALGMAIAALVIGVSDNLVRPWVQSSSGRLHPLLVLISIVGGIRALGVAGVFLGPVIAALAVWALQAHATEVTACDRATTADGASCGPSAPRNVRAAGHGHEERP